MSTSCSSSLTSFQGFHTSLLTNISSLPPPSLCSASESSSCILYLQFSISHNIYVDPHELPHYHRPVKAFNFTHKDAFDIERPEHAIPVRKHEEGAGFVVEVGSVNGCKEVRTSINVPIHLRYANPRSSLDGETAEVIVAPPEAFWTCGGVASSSFTCSPAYPSTTTIRVPHAEQKHLPLVETITAFSTILASIYLLILAWKTAARLNTSDRDSVKTE